MQGVKNVMGIREARATRPDIIFILQKPAIYRQMHLDLLAEISAISLIDAVKSIDELTCRLESAMRDRPEIVAEQIKICPRVTVHFRRWISWK